MRYAKGSLTLSNRHDIPLLKQLAECQFATHGQLFEFMRLQGAETSRESFDWRVLRLVKHRLIQRDIVPGTGRGFVHSLSESGAQLIDGTSAGCVASGSRRQDDRWFTSVLHSIDLNSVRLTMQRSGVLLEWIPETVVQSRNELTYSYYAKLYDAVVKLALGSDHITMALEYERTKKGTARYDEIATLINQEKRVEHILYLMPSRDLLNFVSASFRSCNKFIYFGLASDLHTHVLQMPVFSWLTKRYKPLQETVIEVRRK